MWSDGCAPAYPGVEVKLVIDGMRHGSNAKVSNLINMQNSSAP